MIYIPDEIIVSILKYTIIDDHSKYLFVNKTFLNIILEFYQGSDEEIISACINNHFGYTFENDIYYVRSVLEVALETRRDNIVRYLILVRKILIKHSMIRYIIFHEYYHYVYQNRYLIDCYSSKCNSKTSSKYENNYDSIIKFIFDRFENNDIIVEDTIELFKIKDEIDYEKDKMYYDYCLDDFTYYNIEEHLNNAYDRMKELNEINEENSLSYGDKLYLLYSNKLSPNDKFIDQYNRKFMIHCQNKNYDECIKIIENAVKEMNMRYLFNLSLKYEYYEISKHILNNYNIFNDFVASNYAMIEPCEIRRLNDESIFELLINHKDMNIKSLLISLLYYSSHSRITRVFNDEKFAQHIDDKIIDAIRKVSKEFKPWLMRESFVIKLLNKN
jgi:hypothetical protein